MYVIDFETRSPCDLTKHGAYRYARHPETEVLCMAYQHVNDADPLLWTPATGPFPDTVVKGDKVVAHNATFERLILNWVLGIHVPIRQWIDTAAQCRSNNLPGSLEEAAIALELMERKDPRGMKLVRECCIPPYNEELLGELFQYCKQDVRVCRAIYLGTPQLSDDELDEYWAAEEINDRGLPLDLKWARWAAQRTLTGVLMSLPGF